MKKGYLTGLVVLVFAGIVLLSYSGGGLPKEFPAPDFAIDEIFHENTILFSEYHGRPLLLYFFASW